MARTQAESEAKFVELATKRTNAALKQLRLIGNLGSGQYVKTEAQVKAIESALGRGIAETVAKLQNVKSSTPTFSL